MRNLWVTLVLLSVASFLVRPSRISLQQDLERAFLAVYGGPSLVDACGPDVDIRLNTMGRPAGAFQLARFVAARHPEVRLKTLTVNGHPEGSTPSADPEHFEAVYAEQLRKQAQPPDGHCLVLVRVDAPRILRKSKQWGFYSDSAYQDSLVDTCLVVWQDDQVAPDAIDTRRNRGDTFRTVVLAAP